MSFAQRIDNAIMASHRITGALIAAKAARDASNPLASVAVRDAVAAVADLADELDGAVNLVAGGDAANDRESVHD